MNYAEAYNFLISLSNLPRKEYMTNQRHCGWYLKRLQFFLNLIGNPERKIPHYIHITGTSGKGSVTAYLHSVLEANGKKVGSTYSPHPTTITERWKIGSKFMSKKEFVEIVEYLKPKLDEYIAKTPYDMLSFFEITEAIGLVFFARNKVSWAVMEVACGGRTDSSNIIPWKDVAVITNIGVDHIGVLGNNKKEIAYEKAGIIKPGCSVFTMEQNSSIRKIIEKECKCKKIKNYNYVKPGKLTGVNYNLNGTDFVYHNKKYYTPALGSHQIKNIILCIEIAKYLNTPNKAIQKGMARVYQPLRMEIISKKPLVIVDGAHNSDKMKTTIETMKQISRQTNNQTNLVVGFSGDKNISKMIKQLATLKPKSIAITRNTVNPFRKVADPQLLFKSFKKLLPKSKIKIFLDPRAAFKWSKKQTADNECLLATGSIFLSGEIKRRLVI
jgi:dihydrofolate synthase/folylpolyglutamate synthase